MCIVMMTRRGRYIPKGSPMRLRLRVDGDDSGEELDSLRRWMSREETLRGRVELDRRPGRPDEMGVLGDALIAAVGSGGLLSVLVQSVQAWLETRRSDVTLEVTLPDGRIVKATATNMPDAAKVIERVLQASVDPAAITSPPAEG